MAKDRYKVCYASTGEVIKYTFPKSGECFYFNIDKNNRVTHVTINDNDDVVITPVVDTAIIEEMIKLKENKE